MRIPSALAASALALTLTAGPLAAETVLRYSQWLPPTHQLRVNVIDPYLESWAEVTDGAVRVEPTPAIVGTLAGQFDTVLDGIVDIVFILHGVTPGRLDLQQVGELPFLGNSAEATSVAYWRTYQEQLSRYGEFDGVVPLAVFTHGPGAIYLNSGIMTALDDLRGKRLRVGSEAVGRSVSALGGVPVQTPLNEIYEVLSTGVVDGVLMNLEAAQSFNLIDVLPDASQIPGGIYNLTMSILINEDSWNALAPEHREAIMAISGEPLVRELGRWQDMNDEAGIAALQAAGRTVAPISDDLAAEMEAALTPVFGAWFDRARELGAEDPEAILEAFRAHVAAIEAEM